MNTITVNPFAELVLGHCGHITDHRLTVLPDAERNGYGQQANELSRKMKDVGLTLHELLTLNICRIFAETDPGKTAQRLENMLAAIMSALMLNKAKATPAELLESLGFTFSAEKAAVEEASTEAKLYEEQVQLLQARVKELEQQLAAVGDAKQTIDNLLDEKTHTVTLLNEQQKDLAHLRGVINELSDKNKALTAQVTSLTDSNVLLTQKLEVTLAEAPSANVLQELSEIQAGNKVLREEVTDLQHELGVAQKALAERTAQLEQTEAQLKTASERTTFDAKDITSWQQEVNLRTQERDAARAEVAQLKAALAPEPAGEQVAKIQLLEKHLADSQEKMKQLLNEATVKCPLLKNLPNTDLMVSSLDYLWRLIEKPDLTAKLAFDHLNSNLVRVNECGV